MTDTSRQRSGAHRPRRSPAAVAVPLSLALAAVVALAVAASGLGGDPEVDVAPSGAVSNRGTATRAATPSVPAPGTATVTVSPSDSLTSDGSTSDGSTVDRSARVTVLNGTSRSGLASTAARSLRTAGWAVAGTGNHREGSPPTTVFYAQPGQRATAQAIAQDLAGAARVSESSAFGPSSVTVVLGDDYEG